MKKTFLIAALAFSVTAFSQKVDNKIRFTKGQKLEMVTEVKKTSTMELMGNAMESMINSTITEVFDIENASGTGATIEHKVKRLTSSMEGMGQKQSFDSENEADRSGELGKLLEKSLKNKYTMTLDASGRVVSVKADDDNPRDSASIQAEQISSAISSQMGININLPKTGDATAFSILPARQVSIGDAWIDSATKDGAKRVTNYKVKSITDAEIVLDFTETTDINTTQAMMGVEATIKSNDTGTGTVVIDRKTGLLKQRTATVETKGTIEAQGMSIPANAKTTITTTVKAS